MTKKNLYNWNQSGDITDTQKSAITKFGIDDSSYSSNTYYAGDLRKVYYWDGILERNRYKIDIPDTIQKMIFFSAWWNNNLIIVVNGSGFPSGSHNLWLLVYEMPSQQMGEVLEKFKLSDSLFGVNVFEAQLKAYEMERKLNGENPILYKEPLGIEVSYDDNYSSSNFPSYYSKDGEVKRIEVDFYSAKSNPDAYFKPLDIVKIFTSRSSSTGTAPYMVHSCVYLGNRKVAHVLSGNVVEIVSWDEFSSSLGSANKMLRYHPVIAFKKPEKIIEHIAKIIEGKDRYWALKMDYNILDVKNEEREIVRKANNCEHFVNRAVLGLNFSELSSRRARGWSGSKFDSVSSQLSQNESTLGSLTSYTPYSKINEINGYRNQGISNSGQSSVMRDGVQMQERIEVKPVGWYDLRSGGGIFRSW